MHNLSYYRVQSKMQKYDDYSGAFCKKRNMLGLLLNFRFGDKTSTASHYRFHALRACAECILAARTLRVYTPV